MSCFRDRVLSGMHCLRSSCEIFSATNYICGFSAGTSTQVRKNVSTSYLNFPLKSLRLLYASCLTLLTRGVLMKKLQLTYLRFALSCLSILLFHFSAAPLEAQSTFGEMIGVVKDPGQGVV